MAVIDARTAASLSDGPSVVLVDIRSQSAWLDGVPKNAKLWSSSDLLNQAKQLKQQGKKVCIVCYLGQTSAVLVEQLEEKWGDGFYSVQGGFKTWEAMGLPVEVPVKVPAVDRYERQVKLPNFGLEAQNKLQNSHVLVVGAGGLGAPALLYLAGAGLGRISLIDDDTVAIHNLHRQILYQQEDVGQPKADVAKRRLIALNDNVSIQALNERLTVENVESLVENVDLVVDGSDNVSSRYVINEACLKFNKPWLFTAVSGFDIQLTLFSGEKNRPCYRCLFPGVDDSELDNCSEAGVLGPVPGLAGMLQAIETIKYLTGLGDDLKLKMLSYDVLHHHFKMLKYPSKIRSGCIH